MPRALSAAVPAREEAPLGEPPPMEIPDEYISIVGYLDAPCGDAAALASQILDVCGEWTGGSLARLFMLPSLTASRSYDDGGAPSFWERDKSFGSAVRRSRPRRIQGIREVLAEAPPDPSKIHVWWSRGRAEPKRHFPAWHLKIDQAEPIDETDDEVTSVGFHVCRDLVADASSVQRIALKLLELLHARGCYHAIIDIAPDQHTRGGYAYMLRPKYRPLTWLRLVNDAMFRSLGDQRRHAVRGSCWGTWLNSELVARLEPGFREEFLDWPTDSDGIKTQQWIEIGGGVLLLLSDNIFEVSEFGEEGKNDPYPVWFGADEFSAQLAAWLRLRLQQAGVIVV